MGSLMGSPQKKINWKFTKNRLIINKNNIKNKNMNMKEKKLDTNFFPGTPLVRHWFTSTNEILEVL